MADPLTTNFGYVFKKYGGASSSDTIKMIDSVLERIGEPAGNYNFSFLGRGGKANVFWLSDKKRIIKLTVDESDAQASEIVRKKPSKDLLKVYDVFQLGRELWGIVAEKLTPIKGSEVDRWSNFRSTLETQQDFPRFDYITPKYVEKIQDVVEFLDDDPDDDEEFFSAGFYVCLEQLGVWADELSQRNILWKDLISDNVMHRGRTLVISDLGRCKVSGAPRIEKL